MPNRSLPKHVAIIMDGNGRWALSKHLSRSQGHYEGVKRVEEVISAAHDCGIKVLTLYAFSTENWNRPSNEVSLLMKLFISVLSEKANNLHKKGIRIQFIGRQNNIPPSVLKAMNKAASLTAKNTVMSLNIAFNYGSRAEIIDAFGLIYQDIQEGKLTIDEVDENRFASYLYAKNQPDVDLLIRTSGELRISNFLLWQISYAELYFTSKFWPEFTKEEFLKALKDYSSRERRFGGVNV